MKSLRKFLVAGVLLLLLWPVCAQSGSDTDKHQIQHFFDNHQGPGAGTLVRDVSLVKAWMIEGDTALILLDLNEGEGFMMITGGGFPFRVVAFSTHNTVDKEDLPPGFLFMVDGYLADLKEELIQKVQEDEVMNLVKSSAQTISGVTPLLSTTWDQRCYYNDSCPSDTAAPAYFCGKAPAGCVATTLAQILKYHKWPVQGTGSKTYNSIRYGVMTANFGATVYNIAAMPDAIYAPDPYVARLLKHSGIASQMNYGPLASGTGITDARTAFVNYFDYKTTAQVVTKSAYADSAWKSLMRNEIDHGRPVFYSGIEQTGGGGHAWVLDGYSTSDFFHFNWGWSGIANGYFTLTNLNPLGSANYVNFQEAIIGLEPDGTLPLASFSANNTVVDAGNSVSFSNLSTGNATAFYWYFPGGLPATYQGIQPPPVYYASSGLYDVMLVAGNGTTTDTMQKLAYIRVLPLADFKASATVIEAGNSINFFDASESNAPIQNWKWLFFGANPGQSIVKNPVGIQYQQPGQYPVFLQSGNQTHSDSKLALQYITVHQQCDTLLDFTMPGWYVQPVNQPAFQVYQEDLDSLTPYHHTYIGTGWQYFSEAGGNQFISATSLFTTPGTANNWLVFGPVTMPAGGATLFWRHKLPDNTKRDGYEIRLSTTGFTHTHFTSPPIFTVSDNDAYTVGDTAWTWCSAPISGSLYGNQPCWIGVHHYANNMFYIGLDDFKVVSCNGYPLVADLFSFDTILAVGDTAVFYNFSSGFPDQVSWSFPGGTLLNPGSPMPQVTYANPGFFDVGITSVYGTATSQKNKPFYIEVKPISIEELSEAHLKMSLYPNPASGNFFLTIHTREAGMLSCSVSDYAGRRVVDFPDQPVLSGSPNGPFTVTGLAPGLYVCKVQLYLPGGGLKEWNEKLILY